MNWRWHECFLKCHTKKKDILHPRTYLIKSVKIEAAIACRASIFGQTLILSSNVWKTDKSLLATALHALS